MLHLSGTLKTREGRIESVNPSGTINVRFTDGGAERNVRIVQLGARWTPRAGTDCLFLSDGAKIYCVGQIDQPRSDREGSDPDVTREPTPQDAHTPGTVSLRDVNAFGIGASVQVGAATGVRVDAGDICQTQWCAALGQITDYVERYELCATAAHVVLDHDGRNATASFCYRSVVDMGAVQRDLNYEANSALNPGSTVNFNIHKDGDAIAVEVWSFGQKTVQINVKPDGDLMLDIPGKIQASITAGSVQIQVEGNTEIESSGHTTLRAPTVYVGDDAGAVPLALAPQANANFNAIKTSYEAHQHTYIAPLIPGPTVTTAPSTIPGTIQAPVAISNVNASRAKGK